MFGFHEENCGVPLFFLKKMDNDDSVVSIFISLRWMRQFGLVCTMEQETV